jgi:hypothetical protein
MKNEKLNLKPFEAPSNKNVTIIVPNRVETPSNKTKEESPTNNPKPTSTKPPVKK